MKGCGQVSRHDVTYRDLEHVLLELGFRRIEHPDGYRVYRHDESQTIVPLPAAGDDDPVPIHHLMGNATILDGRGVVERRQFERLLASASAA